MRAQLARFTEWAWVEGRLTSPETREKLGQDFHTWLKKLHPGMAGSTPEALHHIDTDMIRTIRALSYGGRSRDRVPTPRREYLQAEALRSGWSS